MAQVAERAGHPDRVANFSQTADDYLEFWKVHGINHDAAPKHTVLQYDSPSTYGT